MKKWKNINACIPTNKCGPEIIAQVEIKCVMFDWKVARVALNAINVQQNIILIAPYSGLSIMLILNFQYIFELFKCLIWMRVFVNAWFICCKIYLK